MLGENIRKIRKIKKISINKLSELSNVSLEYLSNLENNKAINPSQETISKIAEALDFPVSLLYSDEKTIHKVVEELYKIAEFGGAFDSDTEDEKLVMVKEMLTQEPYLFYELEEKTRRQLVDDAKENHGNYLNEPLSKDELIATKAFLETYRKIIKGG